LYVRCCGDELLGLGRAASSLVVALDPLVVLVAVWPTAQQLQVRAVHMIQAVPVV
jgi:hypothetical protein